MVAKSKIRRYMGFLWSWSNTPRRYQSYLAPHHIKLPLIHPSKRSHGYNYSQTYAAIAAAESALAASSASLKAFKAMVPPLPNSRGWVSYLDQ